MRAVLLVSEYLSLNPDGTFAMLRGGLTELTPSALPQSLNVGVLARVSCEPGDVGEHDFRLAITDDLGQNLTRAEGPFTIEAEQHCVNLGVNAPVKLARPGRLEVRLWLDGQLSDVWPLEVWYED